MKMTDKGRFALAEKIKRLENIDRGRAIEAQRRVSVDPGWRFYGPTRERAVAVVAAKLARERWMPFSEPFNSVTEDGKPCYETPIDLASLVGGTT